MQDWTLPTGFTIAQWGVAKDARSLAVSGNSANASQPIITYIGSKVHRDGWGGGKAEERRRRRSAPQRSAARPACRSLPALAPSSPRRPRVLPLAGHRPS